MSDLTSKVSPNRHLYCRSVMSGCLLYPSLPPRRSQILQTAQWILIFTCSLALAYLALKPDTTQQPTYLEYVYTCHDHQPAHQRPPYDRGVTQFRLFTQQARPNVSIFNLNQYFPWTIRLRVAVCSSITMEKQLALS